MNVKKDWYVSFVAIVLGMIFFWPIGCALLYFRWYKKYGKYRSINKVLLVCGIGLIIFGLTGLIVFLSEKDISGFLIVLVLFVVPGIICTLFGYNRESKIKGYKKYLDYINVRKKIKIDSMCNKLNVDYDTVINDLTAMINKDMINGYISDDELVINKSTNKDEIVAETKEIGKETRIVKCKECGAKNTIVVGEKNECDYCGSVL